MPPEVDALYLGDIESGARYGIMSGKRTGRASMTWAEVCARRLERHALLVSLKEARPAEIVSAMCGAHARHPRTLSGLARQRPPQKPSVLSAMNNSVFSDLKFFSHRVPVSYKEWPTPWLRRESSVAVLSSH